MGTAAAWTVASDRRTAALVAVAALLTHATYVSNGFTWIDHVDVEQGRALYPLSGLWRAFLSPFGDTHWYRPLNAVVYSVAHAVFGTWAPGYHAISVALHATNAVLIWALARRLLGATQAVAAFGAIAFAVHPATALATGAINARPDLLALLFTLVAVLAHDASLRGSRPKVMLAVGVAAYFAAMLSKETGALWTPALVGAVSLARRTPAQRPWTTLRPLLWYGVAAAAYFAVRAVILPSFWREAAQAIDAPTRFAILGRFISQYLLLPLPPPLSDVVRKGGPNPTEAFGLLALVAFSVFIWRRRRDLLVPLLAAVFLVSLIPVLHIVAIPRLLQPHYGYFPAAVLVLILLRLWHGLSHEKVRRTLMGAASLWLCIATVATWRYGHRFSDDETLFGPEVQRDPFYREGHAALGLHLMKAKALDRAQQHLSAALEASPSHHAFADVPAVLNNLGSLHLAQGEPALAELYLEPALPQVPPSQRGYVLFNLALARYQQKRVAETIALLAPEAELPPEALLLLAEAYLDVGDRSRAAATMQRLEGRLRTPALIQWAERLAPRFLP